MMSSRHRVARLDSNKRIMHSVVVGHRMVVCFWTLCEIGSRRESIRVLFLVGHSRSLRPGGQKKSTAFAKPNPCLLVTAPSLQNYVVVIHQIVDLGSVWKLNRLRSILRCFEETAEHAFGLEIP